MRAINQLLLIGAVVVSVFLTANTLRAQNDQNGGSQRQGNRRQRQGNFDPSQFQQRMMDRYRERLEITDDTEWKAIQPLIQNVVDARASIGPGGRGTFGRGGRRGSDANASTQSQPRDPARVNPAAEALQKAIDSKAPPAEIKAAMARYLEYRKGKQADLERAQAALRAVLSSRQEAIAVMSGLL